ncbi:MAG: 50S ribosomal protein L23 [bacterium]
MKSPYKIIKSPVVTEKSSNQNEELNKVTFEVSADSNKIEIKRAIEQIFETEVVRVNTKWIKGKMKRLGRNEGKRADRKRAIVTLAEGKRIDILSTF